MEGNLLKNGVLAVGKNWLVYLMILKSNINQNGLDFLVFTGQ